jgi:chorismate synthase
MNTFGKNFRLTTFGESHGEAIGGILDGFPSGVYIDLNIIQNELNRRRPGQNKLTTSRNEFDKIEILSGLLDNVTTGCPIGFIVRNNNQHSKDYSDIKDLFRPSHGDYTYYKKYGIRDYRGGGRSSARETISRVVAGAFAKIYLEKLGISIKAYTSQVGNIKLNKPYTELDLDIIDSNDIKCPDIKTAKEMESLILDVKKDGDTIGGIITCVIKNCPIGLGDPVFGKLHSELGNAMLSINAVKGFDYGLGFDNVHLRGSQLNDEFDFIDDKIKTKTNNSGGIQGGISNGEDIYFRVAFKPVPSILLEQDTIDINNSKTKIKINGRHDPCVLPRAIPIVEAMSAIVILDKYLENKKYG